MQAAVSVREAVGVFDDADRLQEAIDDVMTHGFDRAEISLLASESAVEKKLGHKYVKASELEDDPKVPKRGYVSQEEVGAAEGAVIGGLMYVGAGLLLGPVAAAGATLAGMAAAAAIGGGVGGLFGASLAKLIGDRHARHIEEQLKHGGLLLWVRVRDAEREKRAVEILSRRSGRDVHVHVHEGMPAASQPAPKAVVDAADDWMTTWIVKDIWRG
jgi:hypothetical protein